MLTNQQRFDRRLKIAQYMIELESARGSADAASWKWTAELLHHLRNDGMSSDETDVEDYQVVYKVKDYAWRHPDIVQCMESIDEQRLGVPVFSKRGAKPMKRIRGSGLVSTRPPVNGLPSACYNPDWKDDPKNKLKVKMSKEPFRWVRWKAASALGARYHE